MQPNVIVHSAAISACEKDKLEMKELELPERQQKGLQPNVITYSKIINAHGKTKQSKKALEFLGER